MLQASPVLMLMTLIRSLMKTQNTIEKLSHATPYKLLVNNLYKSKVAQGQKPTEKLLYQKVV